MLPSFGLGSNITVNLFGLGPETNVQKLATVVNPNYSSVSATCNVFRRELRRSLTNESDLLSI